jgi:hypothetical protein
MWISQPTFMALVSESALARGELASLQARFAAQDAMVDWFRIRLTQLEKERAQMILKYTGVAIETPVFAKEPETPIDQVLGEVSTFDDVGDEIAKKLGIGWRPDGTLDYSQRA